MIGFRKKLNIMIVLYHDFSTASAIHVHNLANALTQKGHRCGVAVPIDKSSVHKYMDGTILYQVYEFSEILNEGDSFFAGKRKIDIIHAWTPRELVRKFCLQLKTKFPVSKIVVHLEDNEEIVVETFAGIPYQELLRLSDTEISERIPDVLSYPRKYESFLEAADGVTVITEELLDFVPKNKAWHRLWPVIDLKKFSPRVNGRTVRQQLGISSDEFVLCYIGSVHAVNAPEVLSLYEAIALVNDKGVNVTLLRTGRDTVDFLGEKKVELTRNVIELGFVDMKEVPGLMAAADLLVQPGKADRFNTYRLPSKIPEFLASGKPVAVPAANIGLILENGSQAIILEKGDSKEIADLIYNISTNDRSQKKLAKGGRKFAQNNFSRKGIVGKLISFYKSLPVAH